MAESDRLANPSSIPPYIWLLLLAGIALLFFATTDSRTLFVTGPLALGLLTSAGFLWVLWRRRHGSIPWFEIGAVYAAVVTLYMVYPLVGFLALKPATGCLDQLFVAPEAQGRGIGRLLLDLAKDTLPRGLWLRTAEDNHRACRFYQRNGLRPSEQQTHPSLGHSTIVYRWP